MFMDSWYPDINGVILVMENLMKEMSEYADVTLVVPKMGKNSDDKTERQKAKKIAEITLQISNLDSFDFNKFSV